MKFNFKKLFSKKRISKINSSMNSENIKEFNRNHYDAVIFADKAAIKVKSKDYAGALLDYDRSIDLNPGDPEILCKRALIKTILTDYIGVIEDCNKAIELNPTKANAYSLRGRAKFDLAFDKLMSFRKSITDVNEKIKYFDSIDMVKNEYEDALQDFDKAIELAPFDAVTFFDRGNLKIEMKDYKGAIMDFNKTCSLDPALETQAQLSIKHAEIKLKSDIRKNNLIK
jgi:tetratricopeptide (TPR) repeat protein